MSRRSPVKKTVKIHSYNSQKLSVCETQGRRPEQQDAFFVGIAKNPEVFQDPEGFFKKNLPANISHHSNCFNGTTLTGAVMKRVEKDGKEDVEITTANIGDSFTSAMFIVQNIEGVTEKRVKILTTEHSPENLQAEIESRGGLVVKDAFGNARVNGQLSIGDTIGDNLSGLFLKHNFLQDAYLREPEVKKHYLSQLLKKDEFLIGAVLFSGCDGILEPRAGKSIESSELFLSEMFDAIAADENPAEAAVKYAFVKGSNDNETAICEAMYLVSSENQREIFEGKKIQAKELQADAVLLKEGVAYVRLISDGHGSGFRDFTAQSKNEILQDMDCSDGGKVAASSAASMFSAMDVLEPQGLRDHLKAALPLVELPRAPIRSELQVQEMRDQKIKSVIFYLCEREKAPQLAENLFKILKAENKKNLFEAVDEVLSDSEHDSKYPAILDIAKLDARDRTSKINHARIHHVAVSLCAEILKRVKSCAKKEEYEVSLLSQLSQESTLDLNSCAEGELKKPSSSVFTDEDISAAQQLLSAPAAASKKISESKRKKPEKIEEADEEYSAAAGKPAPKCVVQASVVSQIAATQSSARQ